MNDNLIEQLIARSAFFRAIGADDIAKLLDEARAAIERQSVAPQPQPVKEPCPECDGTGTVAGSQAHFPCPICTSPQAQPTRPLTETQADALNTLCKMLHSCEEVEGDDGLAMLVPMDLWNEAQEAVELLIGEDDGTEPAHGITKGTT